MAKTLTAFKRAFAKKFSSSADNYKVRKAKVDAALKEFESAVTYMQKQGATDLKEFQSALAQLKSKAADADKLAQAKPADAFAALEEIKKTAREQARAATNAAKKVPMQVELASGSKAKVFPPDIPEFETLSPAAQAQLLKEVGAKISSGQDLYDKLNKDPKFAAEAKPSAKDAADLMWFLKSQAQGKVGPYQRGAMTIPDPDNNLRKYLDKCTEVYGRDSSHLKDQQKKEGGQARGIDFYEGTGGAGVADPDRLLPGGMRTLLYQQVATGKGENRLYLKMETESARFNPTFKKAADTPEARAVQSEDVGRSILHLGNLIKAKLGMSQGEDKALPAFREQTDKAIRDPYEEAVKSARKNSPQAAAILKTGAKSINQILANLEALGEAGITVDDETYGHLERCCQAIDDRYAPDSLDARFGGEVVLDANDLAPALDSKAALALLNTNIAAVDKCQHTDEYKDLVKVQREAQKALGDVAVAKALQGDKVVQSTAKQLEAKLVPLARLISSMPEPKPGAKSMVVGLDPKDKVIGEAAFDIAGARKQGQDAPLKRPGEAFAARDKGFDQMTADPNLDKANFAAAGANAPIVLLGHGSTPMFASSKGNVHATTFGNKKPDDVVKYLSKTLKKEYSGVVYLDGCFTGAGKGPLVFAEQVYKGLVKAGYEYLQIKGNLGAAVTTPEGKELVTPADVDAYRKDLQQRAEALRASLKEIDASYDSKKETLKTSKKGGELIQAIKALDDERLASKRYQDTSKRLDDLQQILKDPSDLQIEALTGTWGPEKLAARAA